MQKAWALYQDPGLDCPKRQEVPRANIQKQNETPVLKKNRRKDGETIEQTRTNVLNLATCEQTQLTLQLSTGQDRPSDIKFLAAAVPELSMKGASTGSHDPPESASFASLASAAARQGPQSSTKRRATEALRCIPGPRRSSNFLRRASKRLERLEITSAYWVLCKTLRLKLEIYQTLKQLTGSSWKTLPFAGRNKGKSWKIYMQGIVLGGSLQMENRETRVKTFYGWTEPGIMCCCSCK